jgi:hypothetical protein
MTDTLIISEAQLREFVDMNTNVDSALLKNAVRVSQDIALQRLTGTKLYDSFSLVTKYIQPFLLYAAYYEALESIFMRPRNNGLLIPTGGENSTNVDFNVYNAKRTSVNNKMQFYAEKLVNYLIENQGTFPELNSNNKLYEQWPDYGYQYRSPIYFRYNARGAHLDQAVKAGLRIADSRYPQYPFGSDITNT